MTTWKQEDTPNYCVAVALSRHKNWVWLPGACALGGDRALSRGDSITAAFIRTEPGEAPSPRVPDFMDAATLGTMLWMLRNYIPESTLEGVTLTRSSPLTRSARRPPSPAATTKGTPSPSLCSGCGEPELEAD